MRLPISYHERLQTRQEDGDAVARHGASLVRLVARSLLTRDTSERCKEDDSLPECEKPTSTQTAPIVLGAVYVPTSDP